MLAVEDAIWALEWAKSIGGAKGLQKRSDANAAALDRIVQERSCSAISPGITLAARRRRSA